MSDRPTQYYSRYKSILSQIDLLSITRVKNILSQIDLLSITLVKSVLSQIEDSFVGVVGHVDGPELNSLCTIRILFTVMWRGLLSSVSSKGCFICGIPRID